MRAFTIAGEHVKRFMQQLFKLDTFDAFEVHSLTLHSFTGFEVSGEKPEGNYCTWAELRPFVLPLVKAQKPRALKIVFAQAAPEAFHPNAAGLFVNMLYENDGITCTTGVQPQKFDLDKQWVAQWDDWVAAFFGKNGIVATIE